jgi:hypothetical protein
MTTSPDRAATMQSEAMRRSGAVDPARAGELAKFAAELAFGLDAFQQQACAALENGHGVLVCAPTGAGKTVVGEFAVHLALAAGGKCFYTTPIKALSNQKHTDFVARYGKDQIGLLTGDLSVNANAPVVVMTTEVLRNMLYADSPLLQGLSYVVMDEVHFLADRMRGAVWEEVILHLPDEVRLISLSATVTGSRPCAATRRWSSMTTDRSRSGSTCWWVNAFSICSTTPPTVRATVSSRSSTRICCATSPIAAKPIDCRTGVDIAGSREGEVRDALAGRVSTDRRRGPT